MDFLFAFRNVLRNKRRTIISISILVLGIITIILIGGYYEYSYHGLRESLIRSQYGHIQIYNKNYLENEETLPFGNLISNHEEIISVLEQEKHIEIATPRLKFWGILTTEEGKTDRVIIRGIIPEKEVLINSFITKRKGKELNRHSMYEVELGAVLSENNGIDVKNHILLSTVTIEGFENALYSEVVGIVGSFSEDFDSILVKLPLEAAQELSDCYDVQEIVILLDKTLNTDKVFKRIISLSERYNWDIEITTWHEQAGYYKQVVDFYSGYFNVILFIVCIVVFFTNLNSMMMSVFERIKEIGTMRSFGVAKTRIFKQFIFEAIFIGLSGFVFGVILALLIVQIFENVGFSMFKPPGISVDIPIGISIVSSNILISFGISFFVPILATIIPIIKTMKMEIVSQILYND